MFRELTRKNKQLSMEDCIRVLEKETRGVLSVLGDEGYPYGMPMNHFYNAEDGKLYFHCGKGASHRLDALRRCNKVSFCAYDRGFQKEGSWPYYVRSVIVFGQVEITEDPALIETITRKLSTNLSGTTHTLTRKSASMATGLCCWCLRPHTSAASWWRNPERKNRPAALQVGFVVLQAVQPD